MLIGYEREDNKSNRVMIVLRSFVLLYGKVRQAYIYREDIVEEKLKMKMS